MSRGYGTERRKRAPRRKRREQSRAHVDAADKAAADMEDPKRATQEPPWRTESYRLSEGFEIMSMGEDGA